MSTEAAAPECERISTPAATVECSEAEIDVAVERLNKAAKALTSELRFSVHQETHRIMVRIVDSDGTVIREIPPERVLDAYARMLDTLGLLVDKTA
jgi:flagellar protein FlaG